MLSKIKVGRPKKQLIEMQGGIANYGYLFNDHDCVKLLKLLSIQGNYKFRILTGPRNKIKPIVQQNDEVEESNDLINPKYFFLTTEKRKYSIENEQIVDNNQYLFINSNQFSPKFELLINKLNVLLKELDNNFIYLLLDILILYTECFDYNLQVNTQVEYIIQQLESPKYSKNFQYLLNWQIQTNKTKEVRYKVFLEFLQQKERLINNKRSKKVIEKHRKFIQKQNNQMLEIMSMEPINYLISKLVKRFNKIMRTN
ncbi:unnamed protein product (macronuclear) [Paramecium tetraurelia]|uniref:Uncharacterized protein n=1 Tax=Paramecium tetraurelia TaxID=5888 RepID=A0E8T1_PARTE|nr:uncharacterized protein GSPATT00024428001 [Paramecium tetraurelia]CAK91698.1 unnamed protein product [Paramecium tetraurelia]|eukprot:XP_001459095.1 hypothetical protein (macronuclear) [Paramecium tetraurelia strain d4-2]